MRLFQNTIAFDGMHKLCGNMENLQLLCLAGLVREQEAGLLDFLSHDGFSVLMRGMQSDSEKLRTKSAFLLLNLLTSHPEHKGISDSGVC